MARILSIQSQVVVGHVGHGASVPALTLLGHEVWPLPTVVLSGHAATPGVQGRKSTGAEVSALLRGVMSGGARPDAVLTGYLGSAEVACAVADALEPFRAAHPEVPIACDPVLGDAGRLYLPQEMVAIYARRLVPLADIVIPNRDELGWITGLPGAPVGDAAERLRAMGPERVFVTSAGEGDLTGIAAFGPEGRADSQCDRVPGHFHGAGDFVAALLLDGVLRGLPDAVNAARATRAARALAQAARDGGHESFPVVAARGLWLAEVAAQA